LLQRIVREEMPPEDEKERPAAEDIAVLKKWIEAGAPDWNSAPKRPAITLVEIARLLHADQKKFGDDQRQFLSYLSIAHLHNAGLSEDELQTVRQAMSKLLNSLSMGEKIVNPQPLDSAHTIFRIDLRDYKWTAAHWALVEKRNPYGLAVRP